MAVGPLDQLMKFHQILYLVFLWGVSVEGQMAFGGHPAGLDWQILKADHVSVIFPLGLEPQAQRIARIIDSVGEQPKFGLGARRRRFDLVLRNQTVISNGYVALAPLRSEFFVTPPQRANVLGGAEWLDMLAIHEYRHIHQTVNARRGLTRLLYALGGEAGWALGQVLSIPNWFFEGDAVVAETALTPSGRGRLPFFSRDQRALAWAGRDYSYEKFLHGSLRDVVPDQYATGYLALTYAREQYGSVPLARAFQDGAGFRGLIYPFSRGLRRHTGLSSADLFARSWMDGKRRWAAAVAAAELRQTTRLSRKSGDTVTHYRFPRCLVDGSVLAIKSSAVHTAAIVHLSDGRERQLTTMGFTVDRHLSFGGGLLAWSEYAVDLRRGYRDFSDIILFDVDHSEKRRLTRGSKYFSPAVSPDGEIIAAVHISPQQRNSIDLLDSRTGEVIRRLENRLDGLLSRLVWTPDGEALVFIARRAGRMALVKYELGNDRSIDLTPWSAHAVGAPWSTADSVYFHASYTGIDNIFRAALDGSQQVFQVTSVAVGAYEPCTVSGRREIVFAEFSHQGHHLVCQDLTLASDVSFDVVEPMDMVVYRTAAVGTEGADMLSELSTVTYAVEPYRGFLHALKPHSWVFVPSMTTPALGVGMNNVLNDLAVDVWAGVNRNENHRALFDVAVSVGRWVPILSLTAGRKNRLVDHLENPDIVLSKRFEETVLGVKAAVPLTQIQGNFSSNIDLSFGLDVRDLGRVRSNLGDMPDHRFAGWDLVGAISTFRRAAPQNVGSRAGIGARVRWLRSFRGGRNGKMTAKLTAALPGFGANHAVSVQAGYQNESLLNSYQFVDRFVYTRGYVTPVNDVFWRWSLDYKLPLLYPDWGYRGFVYCKRIRLAGFLDEGWGRVHRWWRSDSYRSLGFEIVFDSVYLGVLPISLGLRRSFLIETDPMDPDRDSLLEIFLASDLGGPSFDRPRFGAIQSRIR